MRTSSALAVVCVALGALVAVSAAGPAVAADGPVIMDTLDLAGNGTAEDPYVITNASELQAMASDIGANYTLGSDIDASETEGWNDGRGFDPIGGDRFDVLENNSVTRRDPNIALYKRFPRYDPNKFVDTYVWRHEDDAFTGTLEGKGYEISGLSIDRPDREGVGLFGACSCEVRNVTVTDANVTGADEVGVIAGDVEGGMINHSLANGTVESDGSAGLLAGRTRAETNDGVRMRVRNTSVSGDVNGSEGVGGLIGVNAGGHVRRSVSTASVSGDARVGGLVGYLYPSSQPSSTPRIDDSYARGNVTGTSEVGGLVGRNKWSGMDRTYATGRVTGDSNTGGLVGVLGGPYPDLSGGRTSTSLEDSYWDTEATGQSAAAGKVGWGAYSPDATGYRTAEMTGDAATASMSELSFGTVWRAPDGDYPVLARQAESDRWLLTIESPDDSPSGYELEAGGSLRKSTDRGASIEAGDTVDGPRARGVVVGGRDSYVYTGGLEQINGQNITVLLNGTEVKPRTLVDRHTLTIESPDDTARRYEFGVEESLSKDGALWASRDAGDTLNGSNATGTVWNV
jgi:hypothetical protein